MATLEGKPYFPRLTDRETGSQYDSITQQGNGGRKGPGWIWTQIFTILRTAVLCCPESALRSPPLLWGLQQVWAYKVYIFWKSNFLSCNLFFCVHSPYCMGFPVGAVVKNLPAKASDTEDPGSIPGQGRFPWRRKWQHTMVFWEIQNFLENPMNRGVWWATVQCCCEESDTTERLSMHAHTPGCKQPCFRPLTSLNWSDLSSVIQSTMLAESSQNKLSAVRAA